MQGSNTVWKRSLALIGSLGLVAVLAAACSQPTPEERIAQIRSKYEANLNGFVVEQEPIAPPEGEMAEGETESAEDETDGDAGAAEDGSAEEGAGDMAEGDAEAMEEPVDLRQNVLLDIVIRHDSAEKLDGITVDVTMADGERELETWRVWFDTASLEKGPGIQYTHTLEDVDYEPGYGFNAEIRHPVPPEERAQYQEFSTAG